MDYQDIVVNLFESYLNGDDFSVKNNANMQRSVAGLNLHLRESVVKEFWLTKIYPPKIAQAHSDGDFHIHDLGFFGPYCAGWDLRQLLFVLRGDYFLFSSIAACAAASLAIGTLNGEQDT